MKNKMIIYQVEESLILSINFKKILHLDGSLTPICYGRFSKELIDAFAANLHRIDKDVARCDRTYVYFTNINNLKKLRNIMCTYVFETDISIILIRTFPS